MVFKNEKELEKFILSKCRDALAKTQEKVYQIIDRFLNDFYNDYDPSSYSRTEQLLHSLVKSEIIQSGKGYEAKVYFDLDGLLYDGYNPTGEQVMAAASKGLHGAIGKLPRKPIFGSGIEFQYFDGETGVSVWDGEKGPIKILDAKAIKILKDMLIAEGIPIE